MNKEFEAIFCVINDGFSDTVMRAARKAGASGGTILKGRGVGHPDAEKAFDMYIQPEKEILMMVVPKDIKDDVLRTVYSSIDMEGNGHGIVFSLPVSQTVGIEDFRDN